MTVPVLTGTDRFTTGQYALEHFGVDVLILDDGYQHLSLHRDLNILICDANRPFGNGVVFPAGELREPPSAIKRANLICLTRYRGKHNPELIDGCNHLQAPIVKMGFKVQSIIDYQSGEEFEVDTIRNQPAGAFCGIAHPLDFFEML